MKGSLGLSHLVGRKSRGATEPAPGPGTGAPGPGTGECLLAAEHVTAGYDDIACVRDVNLVLRRGEIVALIGPNGAGKTTTLLTLAGVLAPMAGQVLWMGAPTRAPLFRRVRSGLAYVPEGRSVLMGLSVRDNLLLGRGGIDPAVNLFPELERLMKRKAGLLSGGEQQMLTLARAVALRPTALLVDELSLGLSPIVVQRLIGALRVAAREEGISVLLVEQQARRVMTVADRWYLLRNGAVVAEGDTSASSVIEDVYFSHATPAGTNGVHQ